MASGVPPIQGETRLMAQDGVAELTGRLQAKRRDGSLPRGACPARASAAATRRAAASWPTAPGSIEPVAGRAVATLRTRISSRNRNGPLR